MAENKLIFIGGCMRTGTTILHRVLCASPIANPQINECWYVLGQLVMYEDGIREYDWRHKDYFGDKENFGEFTRNILRNYFLLTRIRYSPAEALVLKHPDLTRHFPLLANWFSEARFAVSVRDPRDTIASMVNVIAQHEAEGLKTRLTGIGRNMGSLSRFYLSFYAQFLAGGQGLMRKSAVFRYEDLMGKTEETVKKLFTFLDLPFDMDAINNLQSRSGDSTVRDAERWKKDSFSKAFWSDLFTENLSTDRIGRHVDVLTPEEIAEIQAHCAKFNALVPYW